MAYSRYGLTRHIIRGQNKRPTMEMGMEWICVPGHSATDLLRLGNVLTKSFKDGKHFFADFFVNCNFYSLSFEGLASRTSSLPWGWGCWETRHLLNPDTRGRHLLEILIFSGPSWWIASFRKPFLGTTSIKLNIHSKHPSSLPRQG